MTNVIKAHNAKTIGAVAAAKGIVADDHSKGNTVKLYAVATLDKGDKQLVVAIFKDVSHSVNLVYLDHNNIPRLSRDSVGGVIRLSKGDSVEAAIEAYNAMQSDLVFTCGTINNLTVC